VRLRLTLRSWLCLLGVAWRSEGVGTGIITCVSLTGASFYRRAGGGYKYASLFPSRAGFHVRTVRTNANECGSTEDAEFGTKYISKKDPLELSYS
jgi:hypothetical protein